MANDVRVRRPESQAAPRAAQRLALSASNPGLWTGSAAHLPAGKRLVTTAGGSDCRHDRSQLGISCQHAGGAHGRSFCDPAYVHACIC